MPRGRDLPQARRGGASASDREHHQASPVPVAREALAPERTVRRRARGGGRHVRLARTRKGTGVPYISHLLAACAIALQNGADEDQAIAALLHDTIEDIPDKARARATVGLFGPEVLRIVEACSDSDTPVKGPWEERKARYIERLRHEDQAVLLVSASDKLDNARAIATDLKKDGARVWDRFNAPRDRQLWYYGELLKIYKAHLEGKEALVAELELAVAEMSR
ncbi:MAG: HD domain-containing protein [Candidatus Moduliflexus flocculans]|nr:HD domain-containing protein [Candidatus Moduliflexus flocculans]